VEYSYYAIIVALCVLCDVVVIDSVVNVLFDDVFFDDVSLHYGQRGSGPFSEPPRR